MTFSIGPGTHTDKLLSLLVASLKTRYLDWKEESHEVIIAMPAFHDYSLNSKKTKCSQWTFDNVASRDHHINLKSGRHSGTCPDDAHFAKLVSCNEKKTFCRYSQ